MEKFKNLNSTVIRFITSICMLGIVGFSFLFEPYGIYVLLILMESILIYEANKLFNKKLGLKFIFDEIGIIATTIFTIIKTRYIIFSLITLCVLTLLSIFGNIINHKKHWFLESINPIYIGTGILSMVYFYNIDVTILICMFLITISTDTGAYFIGRFLKGKKLCPKLSPKKTISGAIGGIITTCLIFLTIIEIKGVFNYIGNYVYNFLVFIIFFSIIAQLGDLFESYLKRLNNVKDSSNLLPGHGGLLDRLDSVLFVAIFVFMLALLGLYVFFLI